MPIDKDIKRLVRRRMSVTGERYTDARAAVTSAGRPRDDATPPLRRPEVGQRWIELLGDPRQNEAAFALLRELPRSELLALAIDGTSHGDPRVRRRSCQLLDDLSLTPPSLAALERCAADDDPRVRAAALHTLGCAHCKPDGICLDQRAVAERAAADRSATVRRRVAMSLSWNREYSDDWSVRLATHLLSDASAEIRRFAGIALERIEHQTRSDEERGRLPEPLRRKTGRHQGKWVAIVEGRIVAVNPTPSWRRRHPEARLYFVATGEGTGADARGQRRARSDRPVRTT